MARIKAFRRLRKIDYFMISLLAILWAIITWLININEAKFSLILSLIITGFFGSFTVLLVRRFFAVMLFYFFSALITLQSNNLGSLGHYKFPIMIIAGIVFEMSVLLMNMRIHNVPLDVILAAGISNFAIPLSMLIFVSSTKELMPFALNLAFSSLFAGIIGAVAAFIVWYNVRSIKFIIKYEYSV